VVLGDRLGAWKLAGIAIAALGVYLATRPAVPAHSLSVPSAAAPRLPRARGE
jgi:drug/metabolite transporter (DMT)-like permease